MALPNAGECTIPDPSVGRATSLTQVEIRLLGPVEVAEGGVTVPLGPPRQRAVLAMLALAAPAVVSTDRFVDGLWGEDPPANPLPALQVFVHGLRKALRQVSESELVERAAPGYRLAVSADSTDVGRFVALQQEARRQRDDGDLVGAATTLTDALGLWRGAALADVRSAPFAGPEAVRLDEMRLLAEEDWYDVRLRLGQHESLIGELEQKVHQHPMRERFWGQLMTAQYRCDRQADSLATYARARERLADELGIDPGQALQQLELAILRQDPALSAPPADHTEPVRQAVGTRRPARVPEPMTPTYGRGQLVADVRAMLIDPAVRAVTLTGPGGAGKSRVAAVAALEAQPDFADGVVFLAATELTDVAQLTREVVLSLTGTDGGVENPLEGLAADALVVLDNLESLPDGDRLVRDLVEQTSGLTVLATSRLPLRLRAEHDVPVVTLDVPADDADPQQAAAAPAVQMFVDRAAAVVSGFSLEQHLADVAALCRFLDGFPLAIELAAAQVRLLTPAQILAGLHEDLSLLEARATDVPDRQRTLTATIQWSYDQLDEDARTVADRLALFERGFTVEAVEAVCADVPAVLDALAQIVDARLVRPALARVEMRFTVLGTVRSFARARLNRQPDVELRREALAQHLLGRVRGWAGELDGTNGSLVLGKYDDTAADLDTSVDWAIAAGRTGLAVELVASLVDLWIAAGRLHEGLVRCEQALQVTELSDDQRATLHLAAGKLAYHLTDWERAQRECRAVLEIPTAEPTTTAAARCHLGAALVVTGEVEEGGRLAAAALAEAEALAAYPLEATALSVLAIARAIAGDLAEERALYERRLSLVSMHGDLARLADTLNTLAEIALDGGDGATARAYAEESVSIAGSGLPLEARDATITLARAAALDADHGAAATHLLRALDLADRTGQSLALAQCLRTGGCVAVLVGDPGTGVRAFSAAQVVSPSPSGTDEPIEGDFAARLAQAREALGEAAYSREWLLGRTLPTASVRSQVEQLFPPDRTPALSSPRRSSSPSR
jgi:predicted ATPase/DNA-binding SARP family transcriptional activator